MNNGMIYRSRAIFVAFIFMLFTVVLAQSVVNGSNVNKVEFGDSTGTVLGTFLLNTDGTWSENSLTQANRFIFNETSRDEWSVYINDPSRGIDLQIDLFTKPIKIGGQNLYWIINSYQTSDEKPVNHYTYLGTHNAIASYAYGYILQVSQHYSVTTQLDGGVRMFEIDFVYDTPDDTNEAGVYICHCGRAPHSNSASESTRAQGKNIYGEDFLSKVALPAWSVGATYGRLYKVIQEIDDWLVANPTEIVFITPQNNNVTVAQFDTEVDLANLKTKTYSHSGFDEWPTRSQLIRQNERLIILAADGPDLTGSRYASPKGTIEYTDTTPAIRGGKKPGFTSNVSTSFTSLGNYVASPTDAITSRQFNNYDEVKLRFQEWTKEGHVRPPTFFLVNQVHVGNALEVINEINGSAYQVNSTFPEDPAGDWIVNASADIGNWFYQALGLDQSRPNTRYFADIDCKHTQLTGTHTADRITVGLYGVGGVLLNEVSKEGVNCGWSYPYENFEVFSDQVVAFVKISTNGSDGFFIDQIKLYKDGERVGWHGRDEGGGWCVSNDNDWSDDDTANTCRPELWFSYTN